MDKVKILGKERGQEGPMQSKRDEQSLVVGGSMVYFEGTKEMTGKDDWPGQSTGCAVDRGHSWAEEGV